MSKIWLEQFLLHVEAAFLLNSEGENCPVSLAICTCLLALLTLSYRLVSSFFKLFFNSVEAASVMVVTFHSFFCLYLDLLQMSAIASPKKFRFPFNHIIMNVLMGISIEWNHLVCFIHRLHILQSILLACHLYFHWNFTKFHHPNVSLI